MLRKKLFSKLVSAVSVVAMAISLVPSSALAAEPGVAPASSIEQGGLNLTKTATLEDDGTYTFNLEAFATGTTVTSVATKPADIVLVLDVSGSMKDDITYVTEETYTVTDGQIQIKDKRTDNLYHKCPDGTYSTIHWTDSGKTFLGTGTFRYICDHCLATRKHKDPFGQSIPADWDLYTYGSTNVTQSRIDALKNAANLFIDGVAEKNAVITDESMKHRVAVVKFANNEYGSDNQNTFVGQYNHTQIVQTMTSDMQANKNAINALSAAGATAADYGMNKAEVALTGTSVDRDKIVILFTDGEPTHGNSFSNDVANDAIAKAKNLKDAGTTIYTIGIFNGADPNGTSNVNKYMNYVSTNYPSATSLTKPGTGSNKGYYKMASDTKALNNIFKEISSSVGTTSVELTSDAVMKDIIGEGFVTTANMTASAYTVNYKGRDRSGNREFDTTKTPVKADITGSTVTVTGFDYKANCLIDGTNYDNNDFLAAKQGKKLVLEIKGVEATDAAISDVVVNTNGIDSGIYKNASATTPDARFPMPKTKVNSKAYVLDYAKEAALTDMGTTTHLDADGMNQFATSTTNLGLTYGDVTTSSYVPKTMNWNGYDTYYAFGTNTPAEGVTTGNNVWTKVSVLPATSVYYEDTFVTDETNGTVGIEYSGTWTVDGTASGNTEAANNNVQGWIESLNDDATYSDAAAHVSSTSGATATFTFTGTGVDVYSRTNMTTGTVLVTLKGTDSVGTAVNKVLVVDNKAKDGEYYQIPTVFFNELDYGTYTVTIKVTNAAENDGGRKTYYLDGIRVYNPLNPEVVDDETINSAYAEQNTSVTAMFKSVRDLLIQDATTATTVDGAVFIDENAAGETENTSNLAVYEEFGPKNEVYLAAGQSIVFQADTLESPIYIGLKAPKGETKAAFTNADGAVEATITSPADLYYQIVPNADGMVTVKNTGSNLLSITKICVPNIMTPSGTYMATMNVEDAVSYANTFASLPCAPYTMNIIAEDDLGKDEEVNVPETDQNTGDVDIDNGNVDSEMTKPEVPSTPALDWVKNVFNTLRKWFK